MFYLEEHIRWTLVRAETLVLVYPAEHTPTLGSLLLDTLGTLARKFVGNRGIEVSGSEEERGIKGIVLNGVVL